MGIVDIEKIKAEAKKKKEESSEVESIEIDGKVYFKGKILPDYFDDYGQCVSANADAARKAEYAKLGLNEFGQSKEQIIKNQKIDALLKDRATLTAQIKDLDIQIANIRLGKVEVEEDKKSKKKK